MKTQISKIGILLLTSFFFSTSLFAVLPKLDILGLITGRVIDSVSQSPMEYVNIAVYSKQDSTLVDGTITNSEGLFKIEKISAGEYFIEISFIGFEKKEISNLVIDAKNTKSEIGDIFLFPDISLMEEVEVVGNKQEIVYKIDKRIIDAENFISAAGGTAIDILENTPSIQVDSQGNLTLRGNSDFIVLIDGKPSVTKGSDALKLIPASSIKQIEVITNPSAKYDADGQSGIINVILKKDKLQGVNGLVNVSLATRNKYNANALVNFRKNKINFFAGFDFMDNVYTSEFETNSLITLEDDSASSHGLAITNFFIENRTAKAGIDYEINEKNSISLSGSYGIQGYDNSSDAVLSTKSYNLETYNKSNSFMDVFGKVTQLNLDYYHTFSENKKLSFNNFYFSWIGKDVYTLDILNTDINYNKVSVLSKILYSRPNYNYQYRANVDYTQPLWEGIVETGYQFRLEKRDNTVIFTNFDINNESWIYNSLFSYDQDYKNIINSGYVTYSNSLAGIDYKLGLRSEMFQRFNKISNESKDFNYQKFMIYPSLHFSKPFAEKHQFQLSYSRRIYRPEPYMLNNTPTYLDPNNVMLGNADLKPEFIDNYELNYIFSNQKITLSAQTYYRNNKNCLIETRTLHSDGLIYHRNVNGNNEISSGLELGMNLNVLSWWSLNANSNVYHYKLNATDENTTISKSTNTFDIRLTTNFSLKTGTKIELFGYYQAPSVDISGNAADFYFVNFAVSQPFLQNKLNVAFNIQNLLTKSEYLYKISGNNYSNSYNIRNEGITFMLNISYIFNNFEYKNRGRNDDASFKGGNSF